MLLLGARAGDTEQRLIVKVLWIGLGVVVATDSIQGYRTLHGEFISGGLLDVGWSLGYMPVGLAVGWARLLAIRSQFALNRRATDSAPELYADDYSDTNIWQALTPYALLPCVVLLVLYAQLNYKTAMYAEECTSAGRF